MATEITADLFRWLDEARDREWYKPHTVRQIRTAVRRAEDAIGDRSFKSLEALRKALPSLFNEWQAARTGGSATTARSYESRVRSLIGECIEWQKDPAAYAAKRAAGSTKGGKGKGRGKAKASKRASSGRGAKATAPATDAPKAKRGRPRKTAAAAATPRGVRGGATGPIVDGGPNANQREVKLDHIAVDVRWTKGVTAAELAQVLATLVECHPEAGGPLLAAASELFRK